MWSVGLGMRLLCEVNGMLFILGKTDSRVSPHWVQKISLLQESQERDDHQVGCPPGTWAVLKSLLKIFLLLCTCSHSVMIPWHIATLLLRFFCYPGCVAMLLSQDLSVSSAAVIMNQVQWRTESSCYSRYVDIFTLGFTLEALSRSLTCSLSHLCMDRGKNE